MPTNKDWKKFPELVDKRDRLKAWLVEKYPVCEFSGRQGHDLHEGLVEGNDLKGLSKKVTDEVVQAEVWKIVLLHPANVALVNHGWHLNQKPSSAQFLEIVKNRPEAFFRQYGLKDWTFRDAESALHHLYGCVKIFHDTQMFKVRLTLPVFDYEN